MFMDRFAAGDRRRGCCCCTAAGNVFVRKLQPGQSIVIKPTSLLFKDPTVRMNLHLEYPGGMYRGVQSMGAMEPTAMCGCTCTGRGGWRCSRILRRWKTPDSAFAIPNQ